ncbi:dethiobiotin synthase [Bacillus sp. FJAT-47783]|uniref:dethiobiotin synthase n=1 Tax=Bacillus sp. FJAT-47783 TaxID=2922712 RepID=UPI001FAC0166|nr:dethiobiotin synthase [Bacillus sp. FJAT-47783]
MGKGIFVTGTGTEIGKTFVTKYLTKALKEQGFHVAPYKPIQTGCIEKNGELIAEDVEQYIETAKLSFTQKDLCTYFFKKPASPHLAASIENVQIDLHRIKNHYEQLLKEHDIVLVEGAGGLAVPLVESDHLLMTKDLIQLLNIPLILVVPPHLGSINHTLVTIEYAKAHHLTVLGIVFNQVSNEPDLIEKDNMRMIEKLTKLPILGRVPFTEEDEGNISEWFSVQNI